MANENPAGTSSKIAWFSAITILLSAFLLFQVQPIISRMILPWFGGGPAVWSTCMLFFQVLLLGGYAYAHFLNGVKVPKRQMIIHMVLLAVALVTLPITPSASWKPADGTQPTWRILSLLLFNVGLPYFILSSTGPLVQAWFSRVYPGRSPYRLYALSNIGSLAALLSYPFFFEPWLTSNAQGAMWSIGFGAFVVLCGALTVMALRQEKVGDEAVTKQLASNKPSTALVDEPRPPLEQRLAWLLLPALASMMLLAVTAYVCQDVAVIPFFWVLPLSLYLLSFIICFDKAVWYRRRIFSLLLGASVFWICFVMLDDKIEGKVNEWIVAFNDKVDVVEIQYRMDLDGDYFGEFGGGLNWLLEKIGIQRRFEISDFVGESVAFLSMLFSLCMVCHGELVRCKPSSRYLTEFYMMVSAGGALGGIFVGLICPQVFSFNAEMNIGLVAAFMLAIGVLWDDFWQTKLLNRFWKKGIAFMWGFGFLLLIVRAQFNAYDDDAVLLKRNFYGVLKVEDENAGTDDHLRELLNGRILHGSQFQDPLRSRMPTTYYDPESGVGLAVRYFRNQRPVRVAVVGLGTGTMAAYGGNGDYYCFYEINPNVREIAQTYFTYIKDSPANVVIELGDARISMERQEPQNYDVIVLDAFSGDAIPVHLLTKEALEQYYRHLRNDEGQEGIIAVHVSNRHLDLTPVVYGLARHFKTRLTEVHKTRDADYGEAASDWILLSRNLGFLNSDAIREHGADVPKPEKDIPLWTDQYSNLFQIME
jgi:hypothetical protein